MDAINNMLIVAPPKELQKQEDQTKSQARGALDQNFFKEEALTNALDQEAKESFNDKLSKNLLEQDFLANVLDVLNAQMAAQLNLLNSTSNKLLPDYIATTGVTVEIEEPKITLGRDDGSNRMYITTPTNQNSTIQMYQGSIDVKNRVNSGGTTIITVKQN
jgi:hypothetical protein